LADWWYLLGSLGLIGAFLIAAGIDPEGWLAAEMNALVIGLLWVGVAALWWLGVAGSPLQGLGLTPRTYYPLATGILALGTTQLVYRYTRAGSWSELAWLGDVRSETLVRLMSYQAFVLAILAALFTRGSIEATSVVTLVLASAALGLPSIWNGWPAPALGGSLAWACAWAVFGLFMARRFGFVEIGTRATCAAAGATAASFSLWWLAGRLRSPGSFFSNKGASVLRAEGSPARERRLALAIESTGLAVSLLAGLVVLAAGMNPSALGALSRFAGVGVLMGAALFQIVLVPRWGSEWLVYLAQACMLGAYVDFRIAYPLPISGDAAILTLLGYLDLGMAEFLDRFEARAYARPVRYFSFALPVLPLFQLVWSGGLDEVSLFHLFAAGTFYGIACAQMQWKWLGYAAAVLYNAALWMLWSRLGWKLADEPQFFLVPVGLSAILFAEVNRSELGRSAVNTIRSVGLIIIFVSLAVPIWRFESFGAWLTLLLCSLAGVLVGIGLRLQTFLWLGLATFVLDVVYEMGRVSLDHALAKWAIMLSLGLALMLFVALNEKKRILVTMRDYFEYARTWE
jgi:hypothetical protein